MQRSAVPAEGVKFTDKFGDTRIIHHNKGLNSALRVKRAGTTPALAMNHPVAKYIGCRVKELRIDRGWTMPELAERCGLRGGKQTIYAIENATRGEGIILGTLYALALGLEVEATDLIPPVAVVMGVARPETITRTTVVLTPPAS